MRDYGAIEDHDDGHGGNGDGQVSFITDWENADVLESILAQSNGDLNEGRPDEADVVDGIPGSVIAFRANDWQGSMAECLANMHAAVPRTANEVTWRLALFARHRSHII